MRSSGRRPPEASAGAAALVGDQHRIGRERGSERVAVARRGHLRNRLCAPHPQRVTDLADRGTEARPRALQAHAHQLPRPATAHQPPAVHDPLSNKRRPGSHARPPWHRRCDQAPASRATLRIAIRERRPRPRRAIAKGDQQLSERSMLPTLRERRPRIGPSPRRETVRFRSFEATARTLARVRVRVKAEMVGDDRSWADGRLRLPATGDRRIRHAAGADADERNGNVGAVGGRGHRATASSTNPIVSDGVCGASLVPSSKRILSCAFVPAARPCFSPEQPTGNF